MSTFDRVTARVADLDHPAYADEHSRDVWNEASAIGYQSMSWCLLLAMPVLAWTLGPAGMLPLALVSVALTVPSVLVMVYAQRRGVNAWKGPGTTTGRAVAIAVVAVVTILGFVVTGLDTAPDVATGAGLAVGSVVGGLVGAGGALLALLLVTRRARRHAPVGED